jgi:hypothetical protein
MSWFSPSFDTCIVSLVGPFFTYLKRYMMELDLLQYFTLTWPPCQIIRCLLYEPKKQLSNFILCVLNMYPKITTFIFGLTLLVSHVSFFKILMIVFWSLTIFHARRFMPIKTTRPMHLVRRNNTTKSKVVLISTIGYFNFLVDLLVCLFCLLSK